jgi:hypothetical protein
MSRIISPLLVLLLTTLAVADNKPKGSQERRDNQRVNAARDDVAEAQRKLVEESQDVREAAAALVKANAAASDVARQVAEARAAAEQRHGERVGLERAIEVVAAAQAAVDAASKPVLDALRARPEFVEAQRAAAAARAKLEAGDPPDAAALRETVLVPSRLEREALAADAESARTKESLNRELEKVAALRTSIRDAVESDSDTAKALGRLKAAKDVVEKAEQHLAEERRRALAAIIKLNQERAQLQQAVNQDRKNDGNNKNKKPPQKKKPGNKK